MMLEMESVLKLLHSHLPNQVIEPLPKDYPSLPKIPIPFLLPYPNSNLPPKSIFKILFPTYMNLIYTNQICYTYSPLIPSLRFVNRFVDKSIQLLLKPLTEPLRAIYTTPLIPLKNTTNIM